LRSFDRGQKEWQEVGRQQTGSFCLGRDESGHRCAKRSSGWNWAVCGRQVWSGSTLKAAAFPGW